jgi:hypothetical protein
MISTPKFACQQTINWTSIDVQSTNVTRSISQCLGYRMDGLKVKIEQAPDHLSQSKFYNRWKHDHFVTSLLAFAPICKRKVTPFWVPLPNKSQVGT